MVQAPASAARRKLLALVAASLGAGMLGSAVAQAPATADRVALVIGNSAYRGAPLKNPVNDANAVAASLQQLGFSVMYRENTGLRDLIEVLREFSLRAAQSAVRVVFYAGHGIQSKGRNYLVPVDIDLKSEDEIPAKSADVGELIDRLSAIKHGINIVILDACRVNPFSSGVIVGPDGRRLRFRSLSQSGLAQIDAPMGTLVAFSTGPNGVAADNPGSKNSLYVKHLLANLVTPGLPIELLFKKVRIGVAEETQRIQVPWESSSLTADFCFKSDGRGGCNLLR